MVIQKKRKDGTLRVQFKTDGPTRTEEAHTDGCNINTIIAKARRTGMIERNVAQARYGDFTSAADFQTCLQRVEQAEQDFLNLSADLRKRFANDPARLLAFLADPNNKEEAIRLGLKEKPKDPPPQGPPTPNPAETAAEPPQGGEAAST